MLNRQFLRTFVVAVILTLIILPSRRWLFAAPQERVLWSFGGPGDGAVGGSRLLKMGGSFYGTTDSGGANGGVFSGTAFQLTPPAPGRTAWSEHVLWSFGGDAALLQSGLIRVGGSLYGTSFFGRAFSEGTVYQLTPPAPGQTAWSERVLWSFGGSGDGAEPEDDLLEVGGKLYGTASVGGANLAGAVFELTPPAQSAMGWSESLPLSFAAVPHSIFFPFSGYAQAALIQVGGSLYGTTSGGGDNNTGTVYQLTPPAPGQTDWSERVLWSFGGPGDGKVPYRSAGRSGWQVLRHDSRWRS